MPNRILKESICTSDNVDKLSLIAETAFYRLIVNCDDYGCFDGRTMIIKSRLFPLKTIGEDQINDIICELVDADLVRRYEVDGRPYLQMKTWESHQQVRAHKRKYPKPPPEINGDHLISSDINCNQEKSSDNKCHRNPIQSLSESESLSESFARDDDLMKTASEHDRLLEAAERSGFAKTDAVRAKLIALYADHGMEKMLAAIEACVDHGATNLAYLQAVLKGEPKKKKADVPAQNYGQRNYDGEQEDALRRMLARAAPTLNQRA